MQVTEICKKKYAVKIFEIAFLRKLNLANISRFTVFIAIYFILTFYRIPILITLGRYLIVEHKPEKADLIVCLAGKNIERSLAVADAYRKRRMLPVGDRSKRWGQRCPDQQGGA